MKLRTIALSIIAAALVATTLATPSSADHRGDVRRGHYHGTPVDLAPDRDDYADNIKVFAGVKTRKGRTVGWVFVKGIPASHRGIDMAVHLHEAPCSDNNGGGHYDAGTSDIDHEDHMHFAGQANKRGRFWSLQREQFEVAPGARSIVFHDPLTDDNQRVACVDLAGLAG